MRLLAGETDAFTLPLFVSLCRPDFLLGLGSLFDLNTAGMGQKRPLDVFLRIKLALNFSPFPPSGAGNSLH